MIDLNYNLLEKNHIKKINDEEKQIEIDKIEDIFKKYKVLIKCDDVVYTHSRRIYYIDPFGKNKVYRINDIACLKVEIGMYYDDVEEIEIERIPGTSYVGIYMLLKERDNYKIGSVIKSIKENKKKMSIPIVFGADKNGKNIVEDLVNIPHILISGQTGSGKTNMLTSILMQLILQFEPNELQIAILDSRGICFKDFLNNRYSLIREIKNIYSMCGMVAWLKQEMDIRYAWFSNKNVKDISTYNRIVEEKLPYMILMIDDLSDIVDANDYIKDDLICLIEKSRAAGIYVILSTYRPSVNVIKGLIKANLKGRIAFKTASTIDSNIIIDQKGAEALKEGEAFIKTANIINPIKINVPFVSNEEINNFTDVLSKDYKLNNDE